MSTQNIKLYPPLKKAAFFGWYHDLKNLGDFLKCIVQGFGERPEVYGPGGHPGIDLACIVGTPVLATHDGFCKTYEDKDETGYHNYGKYAIITGEDFHTIYAHLSEFKKTGEVRVGDVIGLSGNTGWSEGPHLHFTLKNPLPVDPRPFFIWFDDMNYKLVQVDGQKDVYLIKDDTKTLVFNLFAFQLINNNQQPQEISQQELDAIPDSGFTLAGLQNE